MKPNIMQKVKVERKKITARQFFDALVLLCCECMGTNRVLVDGDEVWHQADLDVKYACGNGVDGEAFANEENEVLVGPGVLDDPNMEFAAHMTPSGMLHMLTFKRKGDIHSHMVELDRNMLDMAVAFPRPYADNNIVSVVLLQKPSVTVISGSELLKECGNVVVTIRVDVSELLFQSGKIASAIEDLFVSNKSYAHGYIELSAGCQAYGWTEDDSQLDRDAVLIGTSTRDMYMELRSMDGESRYRVEIKELLEKALKNERNIVNL